jgi:hypothetical protein
MAEAQTTSTGEIAGIQDCGTIIIIHARADDGESFIIPFDHSPFRWLLEGEGCDATDLIGRQIEHDGETLFFLD